MSLRRSKPSMVLVRLTALVSTIALCLCSTAYMGNTKTPPLSASAETAEELRDQKQDILDKQKELKAKRNELAATLEEHEEQKAFIMELIRLKEEEIAVNDDEVALIKAELQSKENTINSKAVAIETREQELSARQEELKGRLRALSKTTSLTSTLQLLVSTDSFSNYLIQTKAMERLSRQTQQLLNKLEDEIKQLQTEKQLLEAEKIAFETEKRAELEAQAALEQAKQELDLLYSELNITTEKLHADINKYNEDIAQADRDAAALDKKIEQLIAQSAGNGQSFLSGTMYWPASKCNYISSTYKYRWGRWHRGIDICGSGCYGSPINAAADGIVSYSGWMSGYGYCIMIDHGRDSQGRNITTLYAHSSALFVSVGQAVQAKQHIANIGTSGNVTGPHLHFEVRVDGAAVDPIANGYISTRGVSVNESL